MTSCVSSWKHIKLSSLLNFFVFIRNRRGRGTPRKPGSTAASASRRRSRTRWRRDCSPPRPRGSSGRSTRTRPGPAQHHSGGRQKSNLDCCGKLFFLCYNFLPVPFFTPPPPLPLCCFQLCARLWNIRMDQTGTNWFGGRKILVEKHSLLCEVTVVCFFATPLSCEIHGFSFFMSQRKTFCTLRPGQFFSSNSKQQENCPQKVDTYEAI